MRTGTSRLPSAPQTPGKKAGIFKETVAYNLSEDRNTKIAPESPGYTIGLLT